MFRVSTIAQRVSFCLAPERDLNWPLDLKHITSPLGISVSSS